MPVSWGSHESAEAGWMAIYTCIAFVNVGLAQLCAQHMLGVQGVQTPLPGS